MIARRARTPLTAALAAGVALAACGGGQDRPRTRLVAFDCKDRRASYVVLGSLAAQEAGVELQCARGGPHVTRWVVHADGTRVEASGGVSPGEFDAVWKRIEGAGWRNLRDCAPEAGAQVPIYRFDLSDQDASTSFECEALNPPFPWITLVDELDQLAATIRGDRGRNMMELE